MELIAERRTKFQAKDPMSALTHFIGFLAVIPVFICLLEQSETKLQLIGFTVFGISLMLLYGASTIYHTLKLSAEKTALLRGSSPIKLFIVSSGTDTISGIIKLVIAEALDRA
ncbi:MAG: hemolysin III family protein, partial [Anaerotignum sp.]|nr:hemolysin III family protein [Anaerotignum sp.]